MTDQQTTSSSGVIAPEDASGQAAAQARNQGRAPAATRTTHRKATPWFRQKRFTLPSAAILLVGAILVSTGGTESSIFDLAARGPDSEVGSVPKLVPATATFGKSVRDGKLAFLVTSVQPSSKTVTDRSGATKTAEGMFVVVGVNVTNIGYEPRRLTATDQFLTSDKGQRFATSAAISSLKGADTVFRDEINPGHTVNDVPLLFDVPPGTVLTSIELHDSLSSTGVRVKLS